MKTQRHVRVFLSSLTGRSAYRGLSCPPQGLTAQRGTWDTVGPTDRVWEPRSYSQPQHLLGEMNLGKPQNYPEGTPLSLTWVDKPYSGVQFWGGTG